MGGGGLTQTQHSPQLAPSSYNCPFCGFPHTTVQGAMPVSSVSGPD